VATDFPRGYVIALAAIASDAMPKGIATPAISPASPAASSSGATAPVAARPHATQKAQSTRGSRSEVETIQRNHAQIDV
jgi:hypothetical protein